MSLNKLPDGSPSPKYKCTARGYYCGTVKSVVLTEWWYDGKKVESIEETAKKYFYDGAGFDKAPFKLVSVVQEHDA